jgi:hypothetical protein
MSDIVQLPGAQSKAPLQFKVYASPGGGVNISFSEPVTDFRMVAPQAVDLAFRLVQISLATVQLDAQTRIAAKNIAALKHPGMPNG